MGLKYTKKATTAARQHLFSMSGAELVAMRQRFEQERQEWQAQFPAMRKLAAKLNKQLVCTSETLALGSGADAIVYAQQLGFKFKRLPIVPKDCRPQCGARTRQGKLCAARVCLKVNGQPARRCRLHGGLSTGPKSKQGREAIAAANRARATRAT